MGAEKRRFLGRPWWHWFVAAIIIIVAAVFLARWFAGCGKDKEAAAPKEKAEVSVEMVYPGASGSTVDVPIDHISLSMTPAVDKVKVDVVGPSGQGLDGKVKTEGMMVTWTPKNPLTGIGNYEVTFKAKDVQDVALWFAGKEKQTVTPPIVTPPVITEPGTPGPGTTPASSDRRKTLDELERKYPVSQGQ